MTTKTNLITPTYNSPDWNVPLNANFGAVNDAIGGTETVSINSGNVVLTATQARKMRITVTGTLTADRTVFFPAGCTGFWVVSNYTGGDYYVRVKNVSGSKEVVLVQGITALVCSDGVDTVVADEYGSSQVGSIMMFAANWVPPGYLTCDGSAVSRTDYARLFYTIGTLWGSGNGSTTFNIPDLRGAFLRGSGAGLNPSPRIAGSYEADAYGSHTHSAYQDSHNHTYLRPADTTIANGSTPVTISASTTSATTSAAQPAVYVNASGASETRPKNYAVQYLIKF